MEEEGKVHREIVLKKKICICKVCKDDADYEIENHRERTYVNL